MARSYVRRPRSFDDLSKIEVQEQERRRRFDIQLRIWRTQLIAERNKQKVVVAAMQGNSAAIDAYSSASESLLRLVESWKRQLEGE